MLDATLPDGSRLQPTLGTEVTTRGTSFTIRKFREEPFSPIELMEYGTFSSDELVYFWLAIENNMSMLFIGGTASGKTTSLNAASLFIPPTAKVVSIEDTREITLYHENWIASVTREAMSEGGNAIRCSISCGPPCVSGRNSSLSVKSGAPRRRHFSRR